MPTEAKNTTSKPRIFFQLPEPSANGVVDPSIPFRNEMNRARLNISNVIWDYTNYRPQAVFAYLDFQKEMIESFVVMDGMLAPVMSLHMVEELNFADDENLRDIFVQNFVDAVNDYANAFMKHDKRVPQRAIMGSVVTPDGVAHNTNLDYTINQPTPDFGEGLGLFIAEVQNGTWPNPLFSIFRPEIIEVD